MCELDIKVYKLQIHSYVQFSLFTLLESYRSFLEHTFLMTIDYIHYLN